MQANTALWTSAVASVFLSVTLGAAQAQNSPCRAFEHVNFQGRSIGLAAGDSDNVPASMNDTISSFQIDRGCTVRAFEHVNFQGRSKTWTGNTNVDASWNDIISSWKCECA